VALAEPILRKHRIALALENHKGWRAVEHAAWLKRVGSEWLGVHLDFGNNVALCEDPADTLKILYPYIISCHIKDMAVEMYDEGFLLAEVPLATASWTSRDGSGTPEEGPEYGLQPGDDDARPAEDPVFTPVIGRPLTIPTAAAGPRPGEGSGHRAEEQAQAAALVHQQDEPGGGLEAGRGEQPQVHWVRSRDSEYVVRGSADPLLSGSSTHPSCYAHVGQESKKGIKEESQVSSETNLTQEPAEVSGHNDSFNGSVIQPGDWANNRVGLGIIGFGLISKTHIQGIGPTRTLTFAAL